MDPKKYTLNDVTTLLGKATDATQNAVNDTLASDIVRNFSKYVVAQVNHNHHKINHQITSQAKRYELNLLKKKLSDHDFEELKKKRDNLITANRELRLQLSLSSACENNNQYALDPKAWRNQRIMLDFDEIRAIGGSTHAMDPKDGYPVIDFEQWQDVPEITEKQFQTWKSELVKYLEEAIQTSSAAKLEITLLEEEGKANAVKKGVEDFLENWETIRLDIITLKKEILNQEVVKLQVSNLNDLNASLEAEVIKQRGGEVAPGLEGEVQHYLDPTDNS